MSVVSFAMELQSFRLDILAELQVIEAVLRLRQCFRIVDFTADIIENVSMKITDAELLLHRWPYGLELRVSHGGLMLRPRQKARTDWAKAFRRSLRSYRQPAWQWF